MGEIHLAGPVKLVLGLLASDEGWLVKGRELLPGIFGRIDLASPILPFPFTDYYAEEMGKGLLRQWVAFEGLVVPEGLAGIKHRTNSLESELAVEGRRRLNLDPGIVNDSRLILATTKDFAHRIYLGSGIYAEVTLIFKDGAFRPQEWTYPDYRSREALEFVTQARERYVIQRETYPRHPEGPSQDA